VAPRAIEVVKRKHTCADARLRGARKNCLPALQFTDGLAAVVPAFGRTRHPFAVSGRGRPSQVIEFVFTASPETTQREPQETFAQSGRCRTWQPARCGSCSLFWRAVYAAALLNSSAGLKGLPSRSTASKYATNLRATASVARLRLPFCFSFSYSRANS
jgi:hypothetical protein